MLWTNGPTPAATAAASRLQGARKIGFRLFREAVAQLAAEKGVPKGGWAEGQEGVGGGI